MSRSVRGLPCDPPNKSSALRMLIAVSNAAIIPIRRLRPSSTHVSYHCSPFFRSGDSQRLGHRLASLYAVCPEIQIRVDLAFTLK
jgi:hypothetical protein